MGSSFKGRRVALAGAIALLWGATGCGGDECESGESRCDGNAILSCGTPGDISGKRDFTALSPGCGSDRCLDRNVDGKRTAICSSTGQPDPRCPAEAASVMCVDAATRLTCNSGYGSNEQACAGACVTDPGSATASPATFCAVESQPNALCSGDFEMLCDGNDAVTCFRGWVTERTTCIDTSPLCAVNSSPLMTRYAYCTTTTPCSEADGAHCNHNVVEGCIAGHVVTTSCGTDRCSAFGPLAGRSDAICDPNCHTVRESVCVD
jgi:hypothetical protein